MLLYHVLAHVGWTKILILAFSDGISSALISSRAYSASLFFHFLPLFFFLKSCTGFKKFKEAFSQLELCIRLASGMDYFLKIDKNPSTCSDNFLQKVKPVQVFEQKLYKINQYCGSLRLLKREGSLPLKGSDEHSGATSAAIFLVAVAAAPLLFFVTSEKRQRRGFFSQKRGSASALFF